MQAYKVWCVVVMAGWSVIACGEPSEVAEVAEVELEVDSLRSDAPLVFAGGARIPSRGAFSCDFAIDFTKTMEPIGATIERDRILFQRFALEQTDPDRPGMIQKYIPFVDTSPTTALSGGRYLFQGRLQAVRYEEFITERIKFPGDTQFLDRPEFSDPDCRDWTTLLAWRFAPVETETAFRTERFDTGRDSFLEELALAAKLLALAPSLVREAERRGYSQLQILHNLRDHKVQLVYFASRVGESSPDGEALAFLASQPALAHELDLGLIPALDRTSFALTVWLPYAPGDEGDAALWPNSPPFPEPFCGDGVCVPSRGEPVSCPADCSPDCGDAVCQSDESVAACPSDCEIPLVF
ncbi:MAG: hypothetical protein AAFQ65_04425 [Myxococcota bacterium]